MAMLVSLADMKTHLGIVANTYDAFLTEQIEIISAAIEGYCGRIFLENTYTQTYYYDEFRKQVKELALYHYPLSDIDSIFEGDIEVTTFRYKPKTAIVVNPDGFFSNRGDIEIVYTAGYAQADIPLPIQSVVKSLVEERYNKKISGIDMNFGRDVQQISIPGTINVVFDYKLQIQDRQNAYGALLGGFFNVLDLYRSERVLIGEIRGSGYVS